MKINTIKYVFENKKPELRRIVVKYGLTPAKNNLDLWRKVNYVIATYKQEAMMDIAKIHPDKDLISWAIEQTQPKPSVVDLSDANTSKNIIPENLTRIEQKIGEAIENLPQDLINTSRSNVKSAIKKSEYHSVCGCSGADGENEYSNCNGNSGCTCGCKNKNNYSNAEGDSNKIGDWVKDNLPTVVIGSLLLVGVVLFMRTPKIGG